MEAFSIDVSAALWDRVADWVDGFAREAWSLG